jgi:glucokinase
MRNNFVVGVDIGGTKVAAGLVDSLGQIRAQTRTPMNAHDAALGLAAVSAAIRDLLSQAAAPQEISAIGICAPGPLNPITGVVINPPNLPAWHNFPLAGELRRIYSAPVKIDNDANAAALAEAKWGAGRGYRNIFYATIGTGIGAGIIFDGKIYHGRTGSAAEGGHIGIDPNGPLCPCGKRGCIEVLAAGPAIAKRARKKLADHPKSLLLDMAAGDPQKVTSEMVGKASAAGDPIAKSVLAETLDLLAYWLSNVVDLLEPDVIIIGGGVSSMLAPFLDQIRDRWVGACLNPYPQQIPLLLAHYKEDAGIAGAAALCDTMQPLP